MMTGTNTVSARACLHQFVFRISSMDSDTFFTRLQCRKKNSNVTDIKRVLVNVTGFNHLVNNVLTTDHGLDAGEGIGKALKIRWLAQQPWSLCSVIFFSSQRH